MSGSCDASTQLNSLTHSNEMRLNDSFSGFNWLSLKSNQMRSLPHNNDEWWIAERLRSIFGLSRSQPLKIDDSCRQLSTGRWKIYCEFQEKWHFYLHNRDSWYYFSSRDLPFASSSLLAAPFLLLPSPEFAIFSVELTASLCCCLDLLLRRYSHAILLRHTPS